MQPQDSLDCKPTVRLFDVWPDFLENAGSTDYQGVKVFVLLAPISSELASKLLQTQESNRKPSGVRIGEYRRRMMSGEWQIAEPIIFDQDGHLIDGQHRLSGLMELGDAEIPMLILCGVPTEARSVIDIGMNRRICDIATIRGIPLTVKRLATLKAMFLPWNKSSSSQSLLTSPEYVISIYEQHQEAINASQKIRGGHSINYAPVRAMVALAWEHENHERLERFLEIWDTALPSSNPEDLNVLLLRRAYSTLSKGQGGSGERRMMALKTCTAITAFLEGRPLKVLRESACPWPHPAKNLKEEPASLLA